MDPATTERLSQINQRILNVENERREHQQMFHAFVEHVPAVFSELVEQHIQQLLNQIQTLEEEGRTLSQNREDIIVRMVFRIRGGNRSSLSLWLMRLNQLVEGRWHS
ncbi:hypothetical protein EJD97_021287 [Solanum chilense]|uniref:Uncharacterized protein n=1 Tax=Solanum chilense TaxID=4083 RepID=A0A6N2AVJ1_SOLCI|nr:hypothetical protein EJD97_021287 [Solanum chilense]